jgi:hypothetical protein
MNPLPSDWTLNIIIWAVVWSALAVLQVIAARHDDVASFGTIVRFLRRWWVTRWVMLAFWVWLGWHIFVRTHY